MPSQRCRSRGPPWYSLPQLWLLCKLLGPLSPGAGCVSVDFEVWTWMNFVKKLKLHFVANAITWVAPHHNKAIVFHCGEGLVVAEHVTHPPC